MAAAAMTACQARRIEQLRVAADRDTTAASATKAGPYIDGLVVPLLGDEVRGRRRRAGPVRSAYGLTWCSATARP